MTNSILDSEYLDKDAKKFLEQELRRSPCTALEPKEKLELKKIPVVDAGADKNV